MLFRTELMLNKSDIDINYQTSIALLGSCFSENIGQKLLGRKFKTYINQFGTIFNAASIAKLIHRSIHLQYVQIAEIEEESGLYFHHDFHSRFNDTNISTLVTKLNNAIDTAHLMLKHVDCLFITPGTSWVYHLKENNSLVSNCHKRPGGLFQKKMLQPQESFNFLSEAVDDLTEFNPKIKIIFTLSPVRHTKDGIVENSLSKAFLLQSIYNITQSYSNTSYFPAYEIMLDDLRDYRFYKEDLIHPSDQAISYIWNKLTGFYMSDATMETLRKVEKINAFFKHLPARKDAAYLQHKANITKEIEALKNIIAEPWTSEEGEF